MKREAQIEKILNENGLDFTIVKRPLLSYDERGNELLTPYYGLYNSDTLECINTCKEGYTVSQNRDVVDMVLQGIEPFSKKLEVTKAGSLNGGRRVFLQLAIIGDDRIGNKGDSIRKYVTIIDSNDGTTGLSVGIGDLTMSCQNQFFRFYKAGNARFRHTATLAQKIKTIPDLISVALEESMKQIEIYRRFENTRFQSTELTRYMANQLVHAVLGYDRELTSTEKLASLTTRSIGIMDSLYSSIETEINDKGENLWALHSGVTRWTTHEKRGPKRDNGHVESMLVGAGYKKNIASFNFALDKIGESVLELV